MYVNGMGQTATIYYNFAPPLETCLVCSCSAIAAAHDQHGRAICSDCYRAHLAREEAAREAARTAASLAWVTTAFETCPPYGRARLYRALSACFHPDVGGSEVVMCAINAARDRFP